MEVDANNDDEPLDTSLCVICQEKNEEKVVEKIKFIRKNVELYKKMGVVW